MFVPTTTASCASGILPSSGAHVANECHIVSGSRVARPAAATDSAQLLEERLEQTHAAVPPRISEFRQGPALLRRRRE